MCIRVDNRARLIIESRLVSGIKPEKLTGGDRFECCCESAKKSSELFHRSNLVADLILT